MQNDKWLIWFTQNQALVNCFICEALLDELDFKLCGVFAYVQNYWVRQFMVPFPFS